uniref:Uncharacterized protein n=1 Tax=Arundo donax TaxID=35708 RepID=A0A0A9ARZ7_ARUDO
MNRITDLCSILNFKSEQGKHSD